MVACHQPKYLFVFRAGVIVMDAERAKRGLQIGIIYAITFMVCIGAVTLVLMPEPGLSRVGILGLLLLGLGIGSCAGWRVSHVDQGVSSPQAMVRSRRPIVEISSRTAFALDVTRGLTSMHFHYSARNLLNAIETLVAVSGTDLSVGVTQHL